ncbi:MAG: alpha/beta hydrolase, partial [Saprospiraceae bacterium]|nr:alpha/beta hydrolase [Saprospiraceae bacterium]
MKYSLTIVFFLFTIIQCCAQKRFINSNGSKIWINTIGVENRKKGQPILVFESGHGTPMDNWDRVIADSTALGPLVTYDRPGVGQSTPINEMPTIKNVTDRLISLLAQLDLPPPYLLVGHSLGGVYVRGFANYYPEMLAGLVIIDPADFTETQLNKRDYYEVLGWSDQRIDQELADLLHKDRKRDEKIPLALQRERQVLRDLRQNDFKEINDQKLPNIPVHILTGGRFDLPKQMRSKEFDNEILFRSKMKHRIARWTDVIQSVEKGMFLYSG